MTAESDQPPPTQGSANVQRLFALRAAIYCGQAGAIVVASFWLARPPPTAALGAIAIALLAANALSWRAISRRARPSTPFFLQLAIDLAGLGALLYFSGGATNPLVWLLLLSVTVAATVLSAPQAWAIALTAIGTYSLLMYYYLPLPGVRSPLHAGFALHVVGMWLGFMLSAVLIAHLVSGMAASVRARDRDLARAREQALRDERLVSLGTLAASAAHELGTPLATLAVLTEELGFDLDATTGGVDARRKLTVMREQVDRCKQALARITLSAGADPAQSAHAIDLAAFIKTTVGDWREQRGDIGVDCHITGSAPVRLLAEQSLASALGNIFDNAADASPHDVEIHADWDDTALAILVADRGRGFSPEMRSRIGKAVFSAKPQGHGLGLYLSHSIIERLGGRLRVEPRGDGGTAVEVTLPLAGLKV